MKKLFSSRSLTQTSPSSMVKSQDETQVTQAIMTGVSVMSDDLQPTEPSVDLLHHMDSLHANFWRDDIKPFKGVLKAFRQCFHGVTEYLDIPFIYHQSQGLLGLFSNQSLWLNVSVSAELEGKLRSGLDMRDFAQRVRTKIARYLESKPSPMKQKTAELIGKIVERVAYCFPWQDNLERQKIFLRERFLPFLSHLLADPSVIRTHVPGKRSELALLIQGIQSIILEHSRRKVDRSKNLGHWLNSAYFNLSNIANQTPGLVQSYLQLASVPTDLRASLQDVSGLCQKAYLAEAHREITLSSLRRSEIIKRLYHLQHKPVNSLSLADKRFLQTFQGVNQTTLSYTPQQFLRELVLRPLCFTSHFDYALFISDETLDLYRDPDPAKQEQLLVLFEHQVLNLDYWFDLAERIPDQLPEDLLQGFKRASQGQWSRPEASVKVVNTKTGHYSHTVHIPAIEVTPEVFSFVVAMDKEEKAKDSERVQRRLFATLKAYDGLVARLNTCRHIVLLLSQQVSLVGSINVSTLAKDLLQTLAEVMGKQCDKANALLRQIELLDTEQLRRKPYLNHSGVRTHRPFVQWKQQAQYRLSLLSVLKNHNLRDCHQLVDQLKTILQGQEIEQQIRSFEKNTSLLCELLNRSCNDVRTTLGDQVLAHYNQQVQGLLREMRSRNTKGKDLDTSANQPLSANARPVRVHDVSPHKKRQAVMLSNTSQRTGYPRKRVTFLSRLMEKAIAQQCHVSSGSFIAWCHGFKTLCLGSSTTKPVSIESMDLNGLRQSLRLSWERLSQAQHEHWLLKAFPQLKPQCANLSWGQSKGFLSSFFSGASQFKKRFQDDWVMLAVLKQLVKAEPSEAHVAVYQAFATRLQHERETEREQLSSNFVKRWWYRKELKAIEPFTALFAAESIFQPSQINGQVVRIHDQTRQTEAPNRVTSPELMTKQTKSDNPVQTVTQAPDSLFHNPLLAKAKLPTQVSEMMQQALMMTTLESACQRWREAFMLLKPLSQLSPLPLVFPEQLKKTLDGLPNDILSRLAHFKESSNEKDNNVISHLIGHFKGLKTVVEKEGVIGVIKTTPDTLEFFDELLTYYLGTAPNSAISSS